MNTIFLDTVGLIALWDATDQWHRAATDAASSLAVPGTRLVTTTLILFECGNAAARKPYRPDVDDLQQRLQREGDLIVPTEADIETAWRAYRRGVSGDASIVDHVSSSSCDDWESRTPSPMTGISRRRGSIRFSSYFSSTVQYAVSKNCFQLQ